ncbi:DUF4340 domain-containing protein [Azospirillum sp. RWY-5-1]|uniref:DUF4340 domain-containing protein n=1 Tax=Azospirillum oleiclasticum TaxID=2735135 RepID=A0ABX2THQ5_9PROT|nr:DUF4340 domain-containing protein [Azospirillum oleiclasticum]NYZ15074.1 DUF4340 domain-containing protein [Azospirillum oleiclasticum]NYZ22836.1 DUF4340 domain-containing protein [Azospirillum oleiclasticum]
MQTKTLLVLGLATAAAVAGAGWALNHQPEVRTEIATGGPLFPALMNQVNDVTRIDLVSAKGVATLARDGERWIVLQKDGYPADANLVKAAVVGVAQATIVDARTALPDLYDRIGVQDPDAKGATSTRLTLGAGDAPLASLILGNEAARGGPGQASTLYVRKAGEAQSWLVRGPAERLEADPMRWVDRTVPRLPRERLASVEIRQPDGTELRLSRASPTEPAFTATGLPEGAQPKASAIDETTGALGYLSFEDVGKTDPAWFKDGTTAVFRSFDGMVLTVRQARREDARWLTFDAAFDGEAAKAHAGAAGLLKPEEVEAQAKDWHARFAGWSFKVYDALGENFARKPDDVVQKES